MCDGIALYDWWLYKFVVPFVDLNYILNVPFYRLECDETLLKKKKQQQKLWISNKTKGEKYTNGKQEKETNFLLPKKLSIAFLCFWMRFYWI